jgi:hypothetical protein
VLDRAAALEASGSDLLGEETVTDIARELNLDAGEVRAILRARIWQEVADYNQRPPEVFRGLVQPTHAEGVLNGAKLRAPRTIDWEAQFRRACEAFETNGFFMLIGDRQAESLDEEFDIGVETEVQFVKLTPLVGG